MFVVMRKHMVTVFQATPTTYEMLLASGWKGDCGIDILVGGEAFRSSLLPLLGTCRSIRNVYGPTETTIWSSSYSLPFDVALIPGGSVGGVVSVPVGKPISHTMFYLVDPNSADHDVCSLNATEGELYIGGIGVAAGYLHAPDMTAAKFIRNPFGEEGIVYRTGDLVSLLDGGEYVFIRRLDDQVELISSNTFMRALG
jgi:non-ribosomal peptide synthetase component F